MEEGERREKEDKACEIQIGGGGLLGGDDTSESLLFGHAVFLLLLLLHECKMRLIPSYNIRS